MKRPQRPLLIACIVFVSGCAQKPREVDAWEGTWLTAWYKPYVDPGVCVETWRTDGGKVVGTRHRGGPDAICSLLEGEESEGGRVWSGVERSWNKGSPPDSGSTTGFQFIMSSDGSTFTGLRTGTPEGTLSWWGRRAGCTVNPEAKSQCGYPK